MDACFSLRPPELHFTTTSFSSSPAPFLQSFMSMPPCVCQFLHPICLLLVPIQLPLLNVLFLILPIFPLRRLFKSYLLRLCSVALSCFSLFCPLYVPSPPILTFCSPHWLPRCHSPSLLPIPLVFSPSFTCSLIPLFLSSPSGPPLLSLKAAFCWATLLLWQLPQQ